MPCVVLAQPVIHRHFSWLASELALYPRKRSLEIVSAYIGLEFSIYRPLVLRIVGR